MDNFINCRSCLSSCCYTTNFYTIFNGNCVSCFCFSCNTFLNNLSFTNIKICIWDMLDSRFNYRSFYFSSSSYNFFNFRLSWDSRFSFNSRLTIFCWLSWNFRSSWNSWFNNFFSCCFTNYFIRNTSRCLTFICWSTFSWFNINFFCFLI